MSDPYEHRKHRGRYNRPEQAQTELDHKDSQYSAMHNSGSSPTGKSIANLSNPGEKGDPQSDPINPPEDRRAIYPINYADDGMKRDKSQGVDELSRTPAIGIMPMRK